MTKLSVTAPALLSALGIPQALEFNQKMENSRPCKNCRNRTLIPDDVTGNIVCTSCGTIQDFENFQAHIGGITGAAGTYVRVGTSGAGSVHNYKETKIYEAQKLIEDYTFKLGFSGLKSQEVKYLIEQITDGEYGRGKWFPVFIGACTYVIMRKDNKVLPVVEVADLVGCDVSEMGRMITRVVNFVDLKLPAFDIVNSFERSIKNSPSFSEVHEDVLKIMLQQGVFLLQCLIKWSITTGRTPMPVVAAVLVFVGELNQVKVKIEEMANELRVTVSTCKRRYKELLENLVKVAQVLPWGKDVTVKNILKNAPFVIQYMELKAMNEKRKSCEFDKYDMEGLLDDCLNKKTGYGVNGYDLIEDSELQYLDSSLNLRVDCGDKFELSPECLTMIYSNLRNEVSLVKETSKSVHRRKSQQSFDLQSWWKGESDMSKKILLKQILEKDVGFDITPPSFDKGCLVKERRREKIKGAKIRINRITDPLAPDSGYGNDDEVSLIENGKSKKKRKKMEVDIDWEDLIIETLLLHNVKEEEIEKGYYDVLLALHVFDDDDEELTSGKV